MENENLFKEIQAYPELIPLNFFPIINHDLDIIQNTEMLKNLKFFISGPVFYQVCLERNQIKWQLEHRWLSARH